MTSTPQAAIHFSRPESFQLKGALFPMNLLEVKSTNLDLIKAELEAKVAQSPAFFQDSPVVISLEALPEEALANAPLTELKHLCESLGLIPVAVRGSHEAISSLAKSLRLAVLAGKEKKSEPLNPEPLDPEPNISEKNTAENNAKHTAPNTVGPSSTKIINTPVRSGQQIYAAGDLIVLAQVSAGAEILADGNIHVYGPLRGRALAGVNGNENARIFCNSQEAELVSIAGHYLVDEVLKKACWKQAVQIFLNQSELRVEPLKN